MPETPKFSFDIDLQPDATIVHCSGRLLINTADVLRTEIRKLIKPDARIVLDLTNLTHCDSSGLGAVISLFVSAKTAGARLEVINLAPKIRQLFSTANMLSLFEPALDSSGIP